MKITRQNLDGAVSEKIITAEQAEKLNDYLASLPGVGPSFNFTNVLYYLGGLIAIGAMTLFMNLGWEAFGGWGIFFISLAYAGIGLKLAGKFREKNHAIPAGICATFAVALAPLAIYGLQQALGLWPDESAYRGYHRYIKWHWIYMELGTLAAGLFVAWKLKYPFLVMPIAVTLWYMSMDVAVMIMGDEYDFEFRTLVSFEDSWFFPITLTAIGLLIICLGVLWQKNEKAITEKSRSLLPQGLRAFLESKLS